MCCRMEVEARRLQEADTVSCRRCVYGCVGCAASALGRPGVPVHAQREGGLDSGAGNELQ